MGDRSAARGTTPGGAGEASQEDLNGNYYSILGLYKDNGKENGNYYSIWKLI